MNSKSVFLLFSFLVCTCAYDFIRDALNSINQTSDPCDDFFRHACPLGKYNHLISSKYEPIFQELISRQRDSVWEHLEITNALKEVRIGEIEPTFKEFVINAFDKMCGNDDYQKRAFLLKVQQIMMGTQSTKCIANKCLAPLAGDKNCTRATKLLGDLTVGGSTKGRIEKLKEQVNFLVGNIRAVNIILDGKYREGVQQINIIIDDMIKVLTDWIHKTPWVNNQGVSEALEAVADPLHLIDNYGIQLRDSISVLMEMEQNFLKCSKEFSGTQNLLCLVYTSRFVSEDKVIGGFFTGFNAKNMHPFTTFSDHFHAIAKDSEEMAGKLGLVGLVAGHEIAHSLIEDPSMQYLLPVSSKEAIQCIQNQFNNTCNEFQEESCEVGDNQIDENGADILGLQLAYQLFENIYKERAQDTYIEMNEISVTYQQLFFYASAYTHCQGTPGAQSKRDPHSVGNIRANVIAQHPAFQEAFKCSSDSRMMQTVEKQCIVYGENAPESRKKFQRKTGLQPKN